MCVDVRMIRRSYLRARDFPWNWDLGITQAALFDWDTTTSTLTMQLWLVKGKQIHQALRQNGQRTRNGRRPQSPFWRPCKKPLTRSIFRTGSRNEWDAPSVYHCLPAILIWKLPVPSWGTCKLSDPNLLQTVEPGMPVVRNGFVQKHGGQKYLKICYLYKVAKRMIHHQILGYPSSNCVFMFFFQQQSCDNHAHFAGTKNGEIWLTKPEVKRAWMHCIHSFVWDHWKVVILERWDYVVDTTDTNPKQ